MGYTSVRECILIEIRTKFNLIHEKEWTGDTVSNICKRYDVSRKTYYKWKNRYEKKGIVGLSDTSRRPHNIKHKKVTPEVGKHLHWVSIYLKTLSGMVIV